MLAMLPTSNHKAYRGGLVLWRPPLLWRVSRRQEGFDEGCSFGSRWSEWAATIVLTRLREIIYVFLLVPLLRMMWSLFRLPQKTIALCSSPFKMLPKGLVRGSFFLLLWMTIDLVVVAKVKSKYVRMYDNKTQGGGQMSRPTMFYLTPPLDMAWPLLNAWVSIMIEWTLNWRKSALHSTWITANRIFLKFPKPISDLSWYES